MGHNKNEGDNLLLFKESNLLTVIESGSVTWAYAKFLDKVINSNSVITVTNV